MKQTAGTGMESQTSGVISVTAMDGMRKIGRARCGIKRCCIGGKHKPTCMECDEFSSCGMLQEFYGHRRSHQKIRGSAEFIRAHGYERFMRAAKNWTHSKEDLPAD